MNKSYRYCSIPNIKTLLIKIMRQGAINSNHSAFFISNEITNNYFSE